MIAQKLIFSYSSRIFIQFIQIIASIIVARFAGPSVLGTVAFGLAYVNIFSSISDLGFSTSYTKKLSEGFDKELCLGTFVRIKLVLIATYFIVVLLFYLSQKYVFNVPFESSDHEWVIIIQLFASTIGLIYSIPTATFAAYTQTAKADIPTFIMGLVHQFLRIVTVALGFGALMLSGANLVSVILGAPLFVYLFRGNRIGRYDKSLAKEYIKIALPVMLTVILSGVIYSIDVLLLQFFTNSEQTGFYSAGFRIGGFVLLISQSVGALFFPIFSNLASIRDFSGINKLVIKYERFSYIFIMPLVIIASIFSDEVVLLFLGDKYISSSSIMMIINITMFLKVVNTANSSIVAGLGFFKKILYLQCLYLLMFAIMIYIFVHPKIFNLSGLGVALAMLISQIISTILYRYLAHKTIPMVSSYFTVKYLIFGLIFSTLYFILKQIFFSPTIIYYVLALLLFFLGYYGFLYLLKLINRQDISLLKHIVDYGSMKNYIKSEVFVKNGKEQ